MKNVPGSPPYTIRLGNATEEIIYVSKIIIDCIFVFLKMGQLKDISVYD
jgi:hypothetical protein